MVLENHMKLCVTGQDFLEKIFCYPKNWKNGPKMGQKQGFLNLLKKFCTCSMMKIYIICYTPAQILYFEKFLFLRYRPKCSQTIRLQDFLMNRISIKDNCNCSGPPLFKIQRVGCQSNQKLLHHYQHSKNQLNS